MYISRRSLINLAEALRELKDISDNTEVSVADNTVLVLWDQDVENRFTVEWIDDEPYVTRAESN